MYRAIKEAFTLQFLILFNLLGVFSRICRNSWVSSEERATVRVGFPLSQWTRVSATLLRLSAKHPRSTDLIQPISSPSSSSSVTEVSTYSHQCLPSVETGISQLDHLQARWMQTQAMTVGLCCRQKVVRCRLREETRTQRRHTVINQRLETEGQMT